MTTPFRFKNKKIAPVAHRMTLDAKHREQMSNFDRNADTLTGLKHEKMTINQELMKLLKIPNANCTSEQINRKFELQEQLKSINKNINRIESDKDKINYLKRVSAVMFDYYDQLDKIARGDDENAEYIEGGEELEEEDFSVSFDSSVNEENLLDKKIELKSEQKSKQKSKLDSGLSERGNTPPSFFGFGETIKEVNTIDSSSSRQTKLSDFFVTHEDSVSQTDVITGENGSKAVIKSVSTVKTTNPRGYTSSSDISNYIQESTDLEREKYFNTYMRKLDVTYVDKFEINDDTDLCPDCGIERKWFSSEGIMICPECSQFEPVLCEHEKPSYKDTNKDAVYFHYKRINHFNEWLAQIQGKESTDIPQEIFDSLIMEIKKHKITNMAQVTPERAKEFLKKNHHNKHYEHIPYILKKIGGPEPISIPPHIENKLKNMFRVIQDPFDKVRPPKRKNFLSYSFVINKMIDLLRYHKNIDPQIATQYKRHFPLLRSPDKRYDQECIWRDMCRELGWKYIQSSSK